ncbi:hypothetical protein [Olleya sp. R77988]|uniref:hypothetical protein n=1 Tax=Olleya sp. R77988 TaxID=3093875 RepID=UPI0037C60BC7
MKNLAILFICVLALSCKENNKQTETYTNTTTQTETTNTPEKKVVSNTSTIAFLEDIKSLEKDTSNNPIETFKKAASANAKEVVTLTKDNIKDALAKAKNFDHVVITVKDHTIIKLDLNDCKPSGAWAACMPKAEGYIKKGDLIYQNDYANNIIGLPDNQERLLYLF